ncbi:MAG: response regulator [Bdellovibrio sp.]|nr:MAG: response regulator [Bdellovibrio sp.]
MSAFKKVLFRLVEPRDKTYDFKKRFLALEFSAAFLVLIILILASWIWFLWGERGIINQEIFHYIFGGSFLFFLVFYFIARGKYYPLIVYLLLISLMVVVYAITYFVSQQTHWGIALRYLSGVILLGSFILPFRSFLIVSLLSVFPAIVFPIFSEHISYLSLGNELNFLSFVFLLTGTHSLLREKYYDSWKNLEEQKENALSESENKNVFLASMSHEIRTPLNVINGFSEILYKEDVSEEDQKEYIKIIYKNSSHLMSLLENIIDITKIEAGQLTLEPVFFYPCRELEFVMGQFQERAKKKGLYLKVHRETSQHARICLDVVKFRQIMTNLLDNAIKYTEQGGVTIYLNMQPQDKGYRFSVKIQDTGVGIQEEKKDKVFEFFSSNLHSQKVKEKSTGIGLALCKKLSQALGGDLLLKESRAGRGSVFEFFVDLTEDMVIFEEYSKEDCLWQLSSQKTKKILLFEEDSDQLLLIKQSLLVSGMQTHIVSSCEEALEFCKKEVVDLAIIDLSLLQKTDYECLGRLRKEGFQIPCIALSGFSNQEEREKALEHGFIAILNKSVGRMELLKVIREVLFS